MRRDYHYWHRDDQESRFRLLEGTLDSASNSVCSILPFDSWPWHCLIKLRDMSLSVIKEAPAPKIEGQSSNHQS